MALSKITYANKTALNENAGINAVNKVMASDMNEIKTVFNAMADYMNTGNVRLNKINFTADDTVYIGNDASNVLTVKGASINFVGTLKLNGTNLVNNTLTSTSTTLALSANQGKVLKDALDALTTRVTTLENNALTFVKTGEF